ncbi:MAG TPA: pyridoxamine 5'-phosphate oxidase family protein [Pseudomonadales bacterium]|nr:pyridoxamine 5'-phosphate oxidase family protein [Pseudomonadales bacterium]
MSDPFRTDPPDPLEALRADREAARGAGDANAELGWVATVDDDGMPAVRTLVLREMGATWALFVNGTSPKWRQLEGRPHCQIALWLPSVQRQWRLDAGVEPMARDVLEAHWPRRPRVSQVMDHLYARAHPQSAPLADPAALRAAHARMDDALGAAPAAPPEALALALDIHRIECVQIARPPTLHQRRCWQRTADGWACGHLVP